MGYSILEEEDYGKQPDEPAKSLSKLLCCVALIDGTIVVRHEGWERNCDVWGLKRVATDRRDDIVCREVEVKL